MVLNATVVSPAGPGYLTIFPDGVARPLDSDLNHAADEIQANLIVVQLGAGGKVSMTAAAATTSSSMSPAGSAETRERARSMRRSPGSRERRGCGTRC